MEGIDGESESKEQDGETKAACPTQCGGEGVPSEEAFPSGEEKGEMERVEAGSRGVEADCARKGDDQGACEDEKAGGEIFALFSPQQDKKPPTCVVA